MTGSIGLGLILNVLFWTAAVLVVVGLAALAVIEWFPGRGPRAGEVSRTARGAGRPAESRDDAATGEDEAVEKYRKAS